MLPASAIMQRTAEMSLQHRISEALMSCHSSQLEHRQMSSGGGGGG
jgi:hypothetical protein